jgi:hypothetical protein
MLSETKAHYKRDFLTSDEYYSTLGGPAPAAARDPALDRLAGV